MGDKMKQTSKSVGAALVVLALSLGVSAPSSADESEVTVQDLIAEAPGADRVLSAPGVAGDANVSMPNSATGSITFTGTSGDVYSIGLPENAEFTQNLDTPLGDEALVTTQFTESAATEAAEDSVSARAVIVIPDASSPSSYDFAVEVPDGVSPVRSADGGIELIAPAPAEAQLPGVEVDVVVAQIQPAWAVDANGVSVPTSYSFDGSTLTQSIDFSAVTAFPVVADPEVKWMGHFIRLTYSKAETRGMRDQGVIIAGVVGLGAAIAAASGPAAPAIIAAVYAASAAAVGIIATTASNAVGDGKCLQLDIPSMIPTIVKCRR